MAHWLALASSAFMLMFSAPEPVWADDRPGKGKPGDAIAYARQVEQRAMRSSFADLDAFGHAAQHRHDAESLSRLQHVTRVIIDQDDVSSAEQWNATLRDAARRQDSARYLAIAEVNALQIKHLRDQSVSIADLKALADRQTDWMAKVFAQTAVARRLMDDRRIGQAIDLMAETIATIPAKHALEASVAATAWNTVAVAHILVDDVPGTLRALDRAEGYMAASSYPRPDYVPVYNLTQTLSDLGRHDEALRLVEVYGRLAAKTGTPTSRGYAGSLCAFAAGSREDWPGVLKCLQPFGPRLKTPEIVSKAMLPWRATAYARTGQLDRARQDMTEIDRRIAAGRMGRGGGVRRAEAELLLAEGDYTRGLPALRDYHLKRHLSAARSAAAAMEEVVSNIDEELRAMITQSALKTRVINTQRAFVAALILLGTALAAMFWKQRRLALELVEANRREREAHAAKSAFFHNVSHEIRTPLNGVVAMADALNQVELPKDAAHMVRIINASGKTLERLLSDILDDAKMEAGQVEIEVLPFDLDETVCDIQALWAQKAAGKDVAIEVHVDPALARWVEGDRVRLSQVLNNLVSNALKFTVEGKVVLTATAVGASHVRFLVADTGVGFDSQQKAKIFERFQQADGSITRRFGGTGLGLSISRQLVGLMGGELGCDSNPGAGSRFWFDIRLPATSPETGVAPPKEPLKAEERLLKLLVVDDHPTNRTIIGLLLDGLDMEIRYAENGQEAVEAAREEQFDVVLMDMEMPVMGGLDATRAIRATEATLGLSPATIVILSGNLDAEDLHLSTEAGADGHIGKPITLERLVEGMELALARNAGVGPTA